MYVEKKLNKRHNEINSIKKGFNMFYKKIATLLLFGVTSLTQAEVLYTSNTNIYELDLDKNNNLEAQIHDYINNMSYPCNFEPLDKEYWRSGSFRMLDKNTALESACQSIKENNIEFICYSNGLLLNDHRRLKGIPSFYPVTSEKLAREGTKFRGYVQCFFNKEFEKNRISHKIYVEYKLNKVNKFHKMSDPRDRTKKIKIVESAELIPNIKEMKSRYETVIID
jgi:hypothetical protein